MPNRLIRDGILTSFKVNALTPHAELFYRRLMSAVDDFGRMEAHPAIVLAKVYPLQGGRITQENIRDWLRECSQLTADGGQLSADDGEPPTIDSDMRPLVSTYIVRGKKYLQINNFGQRIRSSESRYPGPPEEIGGQLSADDRTPPSSADNCGSRAGAIRASSPPTSPIATPTPIANGNGNFKLHDWYERQYERHPIKRDKILGEQLVSEHLRLGKLNLDECERVHIAWCGSEDWRWKNGAKVKQTFAQWISDESYRYMPNGHAKPEASPETAAQVLEREARQSEADDAARVKQRAVKAAPKETT